MPADAERTQIGIRLPVELVRQIDARRQNKTRAEYCRALIEAGLAGADEDHRATLAAFGEMIEPVQRQVADTRESAIIAERGAEEALTEIRRLRVDFATAIVGVLTKIGQAVREEDKRKFAREKAETFARRVLLSKATDREEET